MTAVRILAEAQPRDPADGSTTTVRLAGGGQLPFRDDDEDWRAGIERFPTVASLLDFDGTDIGKGGIPQALELRWTPSRQALLAELAALHWLDAAITIRFGPEGTLPPVLISGAVVEAKAEDGALKLTLSDPAANLRKPVLTDRFTGEGGIEGPPEWEGRIKSRLWGQCFNVKGELIDPANSIYCFSDPTRPLEAIDEVMDKGAFAAALPVQAWAGSAAATFAALQGATAPQGGGVRAPSIGCVKWWTEPAGALTANIRGEVGAGYVETAPEIVERIVGAMSAVTFAAGTVAAASAARTAAIGRLVDDDSTTAAQLLDELLGDVSLLWVLDSDGAIEIREWAWGASVASGKSNTVQRRQMLRPVKTRTLGYRRNYTPMQPGDIAAIVSEGSGFIQPTPPSADLSAPGNIWLDSDDGYRAYARVEGSGFLEDVDGNLILDADGRPIEAAWANGDDQRLRDAIGAAEAALAALDALDDDGIITINEKIAVLIPKAADLEATWSVLDAAADALGITTERTAASDSRTAWQAALAGVGGLAWNDTGGQSTVDRGALDDAAEAYVTALETLGAAIRGQDGVDGSINGPALITVEADYAGTIGGDELPRLDLFTYVRNGTDVTEDSDWNVSVVSGSWSGSIDDGVLETTALGTVEAQLLVTAEYEAPTGTMSRSYNVTVRRHDAQTPVGGGGGAGSGGTLVSLTSFSGIASTSMTVISGTLQPTVGSAGKIKINVSIAIKALAGPPEGSFECEVIVQELISGVWTDIGSATATSPDPSVQEVEFGPGGYFTLAGSAAIEHNLTGRTPAATPEFRLRARCPSSSRSFIVSGNFVADGTVS